MHRHYCTCEQSRVLRGVELSKVECSTLEQNGVQQSERMSEQKIFSAYVLFLDTFESWKRKRRKTLIVIPECLVHRDAIVPLVRGSRLPHPHPPPSP